MGAKKQAKLQLANDTFAEFYSELCNAVYRGAHPEVTDAFCHTSDVARATSNLLLNVLDSWGIDHPGSFYNENR